MPKKQNFVVVLVLFLFIIGLIAGLFYFVTQSVLPPGWLVYDDFSVPSSAVTKVMSMPNVVTDGFVIPSNCSYGSTFTVSGQTYYSSQSCSDDKWKATIYSNYVGRGGVIKSSFKDGGRVLERGATLTSIIDMKGYSYEYEVTASGRGCDNVAYACLQAGSINGITSIVRTDQNGNMYGEDVTGIIRVVSDPASDFVETFVNGKFSGSGEVKDSSFLSFTGDTGTINRVIFKLPFSCRVQEGELLMYELAPAGKTLGRYSFQHFAKRFCYEHPVVILKEGVGSDTSSTPYEKWALGEVLVVPEGQDWGVFYVAPNDGTFPGCTTAQVLDVESNKCKSLTGLGISCSSGLFDTVTGECVVGNVVLCPDAGRYTIHDDGSKSCDYLLPTNYICEDPDAVAFPALGKCIITGITQYECDNKEATWNPIKGYCEMFPLSVIRCSDPLAAYNSRTNQCEKIIQTNISNDCVGGQFIPPNTCKIITKVLNETVVETVIKERLIFVKDIAECEDRGGKYIQPDQCVIKLSEQLVTTPDIANCLKKGGEPIDREGRVVCKISLPDEIVKGELKLECDRGVPNAETGQCVIKGDEVRVKEISLVTIGVWLIAVIGILGIVFLVIKLLKR